jgi:hypothetical protein
VVASGPRADPVIERRLGSFYAFAWEREARGQEPRSRLLARSTIPANACLAQALEVSWVARSIASSDCAWPRTSR